MGSGKRILTPNTHYALRITHYALGVPLMNILGSRWILMLGVALVIVAVGLALGAAVARQVAPAPVGEAAAALGSGAAVGKGYTDRVVGDMQSRIARDPSDRIALSQLGVAYLQKARETNDPSYYTQAEQALDKALALAPDDYDSIAARGSL